MPTYAQTARMENKIRDLARKMAAQDDWFVDAINTAAKSHFMVAHLAVLTACAQCENGYKRHKLLRDFYMNKCGMVKSIAFDAAWQQLYIMELN